MNVTTRSVRRRSSWAAAVVVVAAALGAGGAQAQTGGPACPGPAPSAAFPCLAVFDYRDATGGVTSSQPVLLVDRDLRRLVATGNGSAYYQLEIDTPTGAPRQLSRTDVGSNFNVGSVALDPERHRLFLSSPLGKIATRSLTGSFPPADYDLAAAPDRDPVSAQELSGQSLVALSYDAPRGVLYVLTHRSPSVLVTDLSPVTGVAALEARADGTLRFKWWYPTPGCLGPVGSVPFLGVAGGGSLLYFACKAQRLLSLGDTTAPPNGAMVVDMGGLAPDKTDGFATEFHPFAGDLKFGQTSGDPVGERLFLMVGSAGAQRFYAFDVRRRAWTGSRPLAQLGNPRGIAADPVTGRAYPVQQSRTLYLVDAAQLPAPQGAPVDLGVASAAFQQPAFDPETRRLFVAGGFGPGRSEGLRVYEDRTPLPLPTPGLDPDAATHDIDESAAASVTAGGEGSAYGARAVVVGGVRNTFPGRFFEPGGSFRSAPPGQKPNPGNRSLTLADAHLAQIGGDGAGGSAQAEAQGAGVDEATEADLKAKVAPPLFPDDLQILWKRAALSFYDAVKAQAGELAPSRCSDLGNAGDVRRDSHAGSAASCAEGDRATASATAPDALEASPVRVAYAHAEVTTRKDPARGIVTTASATARGIDAFGGLHIGEVRSVATSWAHGRPGTARSDYRVSINQVRLADPTTGRTEFACGWDTPGADDVYTRLDRQRTGCDPSVVARKIDQYYGLQVHAEPGRWDQDPKVFGSPGGAQAIVAKDPYAYWSDFNVNGDGAREVYGLQLTVFNDTNQPSRLVVQLAGVRTEAKYAIGELRRDVVVPPSSLTVRLTDDSSPPKPLAGGLFKVRSDVDGDGAAGPDDPLIERGACLTGEDGTGACAFANVKPGRYVVEQAAAPPGYAVSAPLALEVGPGVAGVASFVDPRAVGRIELTLTDDAEAPRPLPGARFQALADDGDRRAGPGDKPFADCVTDDRGACAFAEAPLGSYVVRETSPPPGYLAADDAGFALEAPGQAARLGFVNGAAGTEAVRAAGPVETGGPAPTVTVDAPPPPPPPVFAHRALPVRRPGLVPRLARLPAATAAFLARQPRQGVLFVFVWLLLGAPAYLAARRRSLSLVKEAY